MASPGRPCTICAHDERAAMEDSLLAGESYSHIARVFGVGPSALKRHRHGHISDVLVPVVVAGDSQGLPTLDRIERVVVVLEQLLRDGRSEDKPSQVLAAAKELRQTIELIAKVRGELQSGGPTVQVVNISASTEWQAIQAAMLDVLGLYPEARQAVADRLLTLDAGGSS